MKKRLKKWVKVVLYAMLILNILIISADFQNLVMFFVSKIIGLFNIFVIVTMLKFGGDIE